MYANLSVVSSPPDYEFSRRIYSIMQSQSPFPRLRNMCIPNHSLEGRIIFRGKLFTYRIRGRFVSTIKFTNKTARFTAIARRKGQTELEGSRECATVEIEGKARAKDQAGRQAGRQQRLEPNNKHPDLLPPFGLACGNSKGNEREETRTADAFLFQLCRAARIASYHLFSLCLF